MLLSIKNKQPELFNEIFTSIVSSAGENQRIIQFNDLNLLKTFFMGKRTSSFTPIAISINKSGYVNLKIKPILGAGVPVLSISRHRCPGPAAEIVSFSKQIEGSSFDLYVWGDKFNINSFKESLEQRGYLFSEILLLDKKLFKCTIAKPSNNHLASY